MKKVFLMLVMVFSFTFVANASNTVEKEGEATTVKPVEKAKVIKVPSEEDLKWKTVYVDCGDTLVVLACTACSWESLLNATNGAC